MSDWHLYLLRCGDGSLYTGISTDVSRRLREHQSGSRRAAQYLRGRAPLELVFCQWVGTRSAASRVENLVKRLDKSRKEQLAIGSLGLAEVVGDGV